MAPLAAIHPTEGEWPCRKHKHQQWASSSPSLVVALGVHLPLVPDQSSHIEPAIHKANYPRRNAESQGRPALTSLRTMATNNTANTQPRLTRTQLWVITNSAQF